MAGSAEIKTRPIVPEPAVEVDNEDVCLPFLGICGGLLLIEFQQETDSAYGDEL